MKDSTVKNKVKIFISSTCDDYDGKYTIARKGLATLLEETGLAQVYLYEEDTAHSADNESSYIGSLDDSDLCIFLIDNSDEIRPAVLKEHSRARTLKKKSLYLFCDQREKEATHLQLELRESGEVRYLNNVHEFADFPRKAYNSVINDIIFTYRSNCRNVSAQLVEEVSKDEQQINIISNASWDRSVLHNFKETKAVLVDVLVLHEDKKSENSCALDPHLAKFLSVIVGKQNAEVIEFEEIIKLLPSYHSGRMLEVIKKRWQAIRDYFWGDIDGCFKLLGEAYDLAKEDLAIPEWLISDILIDLRNIQFTKNESINTIAAGEFQALLDGQKSPVFYPIIDRLGTDFTNNILTEVQNHSTKSPFTMVFGSGVKNIFIRISEMFIVAAIHGSLTHLLQTRNRMVDALASMCLLYDDHELYVELLSSFILNQDRKNYEKIERASNRRSDEINHDDANMIWAAAKSISINHKRFISELIAWEKLCNYFSDEQFVEISNEMLGKIHVWISDENRVVNAGSYIFYALLKITKRFDNIQIASLISKALNKGIYRFIDEMHQVVQNIDLSNLDEACIKGIIGILTEQANNPDISAHCHKLQYALLTMRLDSPYLHDQIDASVKKAFPVFYEQEYSLTVFDEKKYEHIERYIGDIHNQNTEQGLNGEYKGYSINPYYMIIRTLYDDTTIEVDIANKIYQAARETLLSEKQTVNAKYSAVQLIIEILCKCSDISAFKDDIKDLLADERVKQAAQISFIENGTNEPMLLLLMFLKLCINDISPNEVLEAILSINKEEPADLIAILNSFALLLKRNDLFLFDKKVISALMQFAADNTTHKDQEVRSRAVDVLFTLYNTEFDGLAISLLSKIMDREVEVIKVRILKNIKAYDNKHHELVEFMVKKGLSDNNYQVRTTAKTIL